MKNTSHAIAVDVGGTKIASALLDSSGKIERLRKEATIRSDAESSILQLTRLIEETIESLRDDAHKVYGIGIAVPGIVESASGVVVWAPNLPGWQDLKLRKRLQERPDLETPIVIEDDEYDQRNVS